VSQQSAYSELTPEDLSLMRDALKRIIRDAVRVQDIKEAGTHLSQINVELKAREQNK
jgi:hypothetical protein